jgi:hypothetical protein
MNRPWNWRSEAFSLFLACYRGGFLLIIKFDPMAGNKNPGAGCAAAQAAAICFPRWILLRSTFLAPRALLSPYPLHKGKRRAAACGNTLADLR